MKLSLIWLKDYIKIKFSPEKLAELLSFSGTEVEAIEQAGALEKVVVAEILEIKSHPNADKLQLATVDIGRKKLTIVCGAPNIKVGQKVPLAMVGAVLPNGLEIKKAVIRGVESEGMLCAEDELGLSDDHSGIMILESTAKIGENVVKGSGQAAVLDLAITPNRADCFSVLGLAREVSALTGEKVKWPAIRFPKISKEKIDFQVKVEDKKLCPKYTVRVIKNITIKESPSWLKERLSAAGMRPINNVVDVTNFVMLEMGQPLHAFDKKKVSEIIVRKVKKGEKIMTIDGESRELDESMLVIADAKKPIAVAGVMGGLESEVTVKTTDIILESAQFNPVSVRKTGQKLGLRSEASLRFEKSIDWQITEVASDRAAALIAELGGGEVAEEQIIVAAKKFQPATIKLSLNYLNNLLGAEIPKAKVTAYLKALGFEVKDSKGELNVKVPSWREDVKIPADLVEEVGRLFDYNKLKPSYLTAELRPVILSQEKQLVRKIQDILVGAGFSEVINYSFYGQTPCCCGPDYHLEVANPINPDQRYLRLDLEPRIKENIEKNIREFEQVKIFEIGQTYHPHQKGELPEEKKMLAAAYAAKKLKGETAIDYLKGLTQLLFEELNIDSEKINFSLLKDVLGIKIDYNNKFLGTIIFNQQLNYGLLRLTLDELVKDASARKIYQPLAKFPAIIRDLAFEVEKNVLYNEIKEAVKRMDKLIVGVDYLSTYHLSDNKKSLAFRVIYQSAERTLRSEEVDKIQEIIIKELDKKFKAKLR